MTFQDCVTQCARVPDLVENFDRLAGTHLSDINGRSPLERMIDDATGRDWDDDCRKFVAFVWDCVWTRLPVETARKVGR